MKIRIAPIAAALACAGAALVSAQQPLPVAGAGRQQFKTVEVSTDRRVTMRISAPGVTTAEALIAGKTYPMTKDGKGVWSATSDPLEPQLYLYAFRLGGARVNEAEVLVPASSPAVYEVQAVPHGTVTLVNYRSAVQNGRDRRLRIYLPPQYYTEPARKFPVLYLFAGQDEAQWTEEGRAQHVFDNLIAQGRAVPMIVVMPNNTIRDDIASSAETVAVLERELPAEIMPMVEKNYRTLAGRDNRAVAGLSFGGGTAFGVGMRHLDWFGYVGEFATGTFGGLANPTTGYVSYLIPYDAEKIAPGIYRNLAAPATKPKLFYMSCGEDDPRLPFQRAAFEDFRKRGIQPVFTTFPGGHEFKFFRAGLADFATRIFKG